MARQRCFPPYGGKKTVVPIFGFGEAKSIGVTTSAMSDLKKQIKPPQRFNVLKSPRRRKDSPKFHVEYTNNLQSSLALPNGDLLYPLARTKPVVLALRVTIGSAGK